MYLFGKKMKHYLDVNKEDLFYIFMEKIFKISGSRKSKTIMASKASKIYNF